VIDLDVPQAVVHFGGPGLARSDPDFMAAYIVNHILRGGAFSSRLYVEGPEKRGLAYRISDRLVWLNHAALFLRTTAPPAHGHGSDRGQHRARDPPARRGRTDRGGIRQGQDLSQGPLCARPGFLEPNREPTRADAD